MNLQELINKRLFLTYNQEDSLISLLSYNCSKEIKREVAAKISYKFYSIFDGEDFTRKMFVRDTFIECGEGVSIPDIRKKILDFPYGDRL